MDSVFTSATFLLTNQMFANQKDKVKLAAFN